MADHDPPASILHETIIRGRNIAKSTRARYLRDLDVWIGFAGKDPIHWTRERAQDFYDFLLQTKALKPQSANRLMSSVQYASRWWSHKLNRPELDFAQVQKAPRRKPEQRHAIDQAHAIRLLKACSDDDPASLRDFAIVVVGLETGMRAMSLRSMMLEWTMLYPHAARYPHALVFAKGTGIERDEDRVPVPLSDTAIRSLESWIAWLANNGISSGPIFRGLDETMQRSGANKTTAKPDGVSESMIGKMLIRRCAQANIPHVHPHLFRHTFVTWRADAGLAPHEIAAVTGHTISGIGALAGYIDMVAIAEKVRNSTPTWLRDLVASRV